MIEEIINKLDQRGLMVLTVLIGKRMLELLKDSKDEPKNTKDIILTGTKVNVSIPNHPKVII